MYFLKHKNKTILKILFYEFYLWFQSIKKKKKIFSLYLSFLI